MAVKKEDMTGVVRSTDLEANIGKTIMADYVKEMDDKIISLFKQPGYNVSIPGVCNFADGVPELQERLVRLYNGTMGLYNEVNDIPFQLKVAQGALLDGLCFGYDVDNRTFELYTMNFKALFNMNITDIDMAKQCMDKNKLGLLKGYKIEVEYNETPGEFKFKAVNHRKPIDDEEHVFLVPYMAILRLMKMIEHFLDGNAVLKIVQDIGGVEKLRCITKNSKVLSTFCDTEGALEGISPAFFPLKAFFYAPVLGAPSTTAMVTKVNLFDLCELRKMPSVASIRKLGIEKCEDPVEQMLLEQSVLQNMASLKASNPHKYSDIIADLPRNETLLGNIEADQVSTTILSKYMHSLKHKELKELVSKIPGVSEDIARKQEIFKGYTPLELNEETLNPGYLRKLLKNNICKFIIRKKDCTLSSIMCTNSPKLLTKLYGEGYFGKYEGFSIRFDELIEELSNGRPLEDALNENGFGGNPKITEIIDSIGKKATTDKTNFVEELKSQMAKELGVQQKEKSSTSNIMVRTCNAYISEENGSVVDYYRYLDPSKIVKAAILG